MERPKPRIDRPDRSAELRSHAEGVARGYADHLSELDLTVFLESDVCAEWVSGRAPIASGITVIDGKLYDVRFADLEADREASWSQDALWDASYARILADREGRVADLLEKKLESQRSPADAERELFACWWHFRLAGDIWIYRGDALQGHQMMSEAVNDLVRALFLANAELVPHEKWLVHMSRSLAWMPPRWEDRLASALSTGDLSVGSVQRRQEEIELLWSEIDEYAVRRSADLPVRLMQRTFYELLAMLAERGEVPLSEWTIRAAPSLLAAEPFHTLARVVDDRVVLDREALLTIGPDSMYSWHYEVVEAVRGP